MDPDNTVPTLSRSASQAHHPTLDLLYPIFLDLVAHFEAPDELALTPTYISLLSCIFPVEQGFFVGSGYGPEGTRGTRSTDYAAFLVVYHSFCRTPVLFVEIRTLAALSLESARERAENNMRSRFSSYHDPVTEVIYGLSIFGSRIAFYGYEKVTQQKIPAMLPREIPCPDDAVPAETRWNCDLLAPGGSTVLREVVNAIKFWINAVYIPESTPPDLFISSTSPPQSDEQALKQSDIDISP